MTRCFLPTLLVALILITGCAGAAPSPATAPPSATPIPPTTTPPLPTSTPAPPTATPKRTATATRPPLTGSGGGVIAFVSNQSGSQEIYIMNADGSDQRRLTYDPSTNAWPNWSPDGKQMVFQSNRSGALNIYVMNVLGDDSKVSQLSNSQAGRGGSWEPAWSPDGKWIAYSAQQANGSDLFLVNVDGTERRRLTDNKAIDGCPTWSPDGKQIAFFSDRDGNWEIYVMNTDGSNVRRLTQNPGQDHSPVWSPDGSRIAFVSERDGNEEIYLINPDGTRLQRLTNNKAEDWYPAWSPDGKWIAFSSNRDGNHEIYIMPVAGALRGTDGSDAKRLTNNNTQDWGPVWRPPASPTSTPIPPTIAPLPLTATPISPTAAPVSATQTLTPPSRPASDGSLTAPIGELGDTWTRPTDEMKMVYVPAATFKMGSDDQGLKYAQQLCEKYEDDNHAISVASCAASSDQRADERLAHTVILDGYWIDRTEVTNQQYRRCVDAKVCTPPVDTSSYTRKSYYGNATYDNYPVVWVTQQQAADYCRWAGARLPTEAEWEYAARGPEGRIFPWGNTFDGKRLNYCDASCAAGPNDKTVDDGYADTAPVGSFPAGISWCGALDLAGNVREWVADYYGRYPPRSEVNPTGPISGTSWIPRGGCWLDTPVNVRSTNRGENSLDYTRHKVGFRCAKSSK